MWIFPLLAGAVSLVFCGLLLRAYLQRSKLHMLFWGTALAMFAVASGAVALGLVTGWSADLYRTYYYFGAIANVPVLAAGTVLLLAPRPAGIAVALAVTLAVVVAGFRVWGTLPVEAGLATGGIPSGADTMPEGIRTLSRYYSFGGFFVVVGGALWSAWRHARARPDMRALAVGNLLIATGTFVVALASGFARYGQGAIFSVGLALGVALMFTGFLKTRAPAGSP